MENLKHSEQLEQALRDAFKAGVELGKHQSYFDSPLDEDEYIKYIFKTDNQKEETIQVTYKQIKMTCGWSNFCDVTGSNPYAVKEYGIDDSEKFDIPLSQYKQLKWVVTC